MRSPVPFDIPGQRKSSPVCTEGAAPGINVVTAEIIVDLDGPKERAPPQLSRLKREAALAHSARYATIGMET